MSTLLGSSLLIKPAINLSQLSIDVDKVWPVFTSTSHTPAWYSANYANRKAINVSGNALTGTQSNVVIPLNILNTSGTDAGLTVYVNGNCRADFNDLVFTKADGVTPIKHAIFNVSGTSALVMVQLNSVPAAGATFYFYYNNPAAADTSDTSLFILYETMLIAPSGTLGGSAVYDGVNHWVTLNNGSSTQGSLRYTLGADPVNFGIAWQQKMTGGADSEFAFGESSDVYPISGDNSAHGWNFVTSNYLAGYTRVYNQGGASVSAGLGSLNDGNFHTMLGLINQSASDLTHRDYLFAADFATLISGSTSSAPPSDPHFGWNARSGGVAGAHYVGRAAIFTYGVVGETWGVQELYTNTVTYGVTTLKQLAATMAKGDLLTFDGTVLVKIASDSIGKNLIAQDPGNLPVWGYPP